MDSDKFSSDLKQDGRSARPGESEGVGSIASQVQASVNLGPECADKTARSGRFLWTPARVKTLAELWKRGVPVKEIGVVIGVGKNAVVGKASRLGLPRRESPICPAKNPRPLKLEANRGLPQLADLRDGQCHWPFGNPGDPDFWFCGRPVVTGRPYCQEHCLIAYQGKQAAP